MSYIVKEIVNPQDARLKAYQLSKIVEIEDVAGNKVNIAQPITFDNGLESVTIDQLDGGIANIDNQIAQLNEVKTNLQSMLADINIFRANITTIEETK